MLAQRTRLIAAELDVIGADVDGLFAKVFGQDAADLAITDESDMPTV
jgi:hypothetical protein